MTSGTIDVNSAEGKLPAAPATELTNPAVSYQALGNYLDLLLDMICVVSAEGRFIYVSASVSRILGYSPAELLGQPMLDFVWPADRAMTVEQAGRVMAGQAGTHFDNRYRHKNGSAVCLSWSARWSEADQLRVAVARDITAIRQAQARQQAVYEISEAAQHSHDLAQLYQQVATIVAGLLAVRHFVIALPQTESGWEIRYQQEWRYPGDQQAMCVPDPASLCYELNLQSAGQISSGADQGWLVLPMQDGGTLLGMIMVHPGADLQYSSTDLELLGFVTTQISAAISRKTMLMRLQQLALYDSLTGLANRTLLLDRLQSALQRASRDELPLALLYLDLDRFKQVNDSFGHQIGDLLLQQTAQRIVQAVRQTDTVARFGGDEFVILLEQLDQPQTAIKVAEKVRQALSLPFALSGQQFDISPSIGVALFPDHGADSRQLLLRADVAMYSAKHRGGSQVVQAGQPE